MKPIVWLTCALAALLGCKRADDYSGKPPPGAAEHGSPGNEGGSGADTTEGSPAAAPAAP